MSADSPGLIAAVVALVVLAAVLTTIEAALSSFSRARAARARPRAAPRAPSALLRLLDDAAHHLNALLVLRLLAETSAVVLSTAMVLDLLGPDAVDARSSQRSG